MATNIFSGAWGRLATLEVLSGVVSQNIAANTSRVRVWAVLYMTSPGSIYGVSPTLYFNVDNQQGSAVVNINLQSGQKATLWSKEFDITHDGDGKKTINIAVELPINQANYGTTRVAYDMTLQQITRTSSVYVGSGDIGSPMIINISSADSSLKHTVSYAIGSKSGTIASNVDTSCTWTPPMDICSTLPNAISGTATITVDTYSGSTKIGTSTGYATLSVPSSVAPTLDSITLSETDPLVKALVKDGKNFVQILSNIQANFNGASGAYGSTITGYRAEIVGKNLSIDANGGKFTMLNFNGSATIRAIVTDSRGRTSAPKDISVNVIEYFSPSLHFTAQRSGSAGTTITVSRTAKIAPITINNTQTNVMSINFQYIPFGSSTKIDDTGSANGWWTAMSSLTGSSANLGASFPTTTSYKIIGTISDRFTSYSFEASVGTESYPFTALKNAIGFGKTPEGANIVDSAWPYKYADKEIQNWALTQGDTKRGFGKNLGETNPDTVIGTGYYWISITQFGDYGQLEVVRFGENEAQQTFTLRNGNRTYRRYKKYDTGVWTPWVVEGIDNFYPIGSIYQSTANTDPSTFMGGTWERFGNGRVLVGVNESDSDFNIVNKTGGEKMHTLTVNEMPSHEHGQNVSAGSGSGPAIRRDYQSEGTGVAYPQGISTQHAGGGQAHNNLQPYITVYMWRRTA